MRHTPISKMIQWAFSKRRNMMDTEELINALIYFIQDREGEYPVRVVKDNQTYKFSVEDKGGSINIVVSD